MIEVKVGHNIKQVSRGLGKLQRGLCDKAAVMALNKTVAKGKTEMGRAIRSEFAIKAADVRPRLQVIRARRGKLVAELNPFASARRGRSLNLIRFLENKVTMAEGRRRKKSGTQNVLRFKIKKGSAPKTIKGAFVGNKGRTVFRRTGKERLPIEAVSTIDVPQMFNTKRINKRVVAKIQKDFPIEFERAARLVLRRFNK